MRVPGSLGARFFGVAAVLFASFLLVGLVLPGTWEVERTARLEAPPEAVFGLLDAPEGWRAWTPWPDSGLTTAGPARGRGASLSWDDPELGDGTFRIIEARAPELVRYEVDVQDGTMHTEGTLRLTPDGAGTTVTWREEGDFGPNPLMGYWAFFMEKAQGDQMGSSLARLGEAVTAAGAPTR